MYSAMLSSWTRGNTIVFGGSKALTRPNLVSSKTFCFFSLGSNQYRARRVDSKCVINDGSNKRQTENGSGDAVN